MQPCKYLIIFFLFFTVRACHEAKTDKQFDDASANKTYVINPYISKLQQTVNAHPGTISLRMKLVDALDSLNMFKPAVQQIDSLIMNDKFNYELWYRKGHLLENAEDTAGAIDAYKHAIEIYPDANALLSLANLYAEQKNITVIDLCNQVLDLRLGRTIDANCSFIEGVYYARTGQTEKAFSMFNQSIILNVTLMEAYMEKGFIYYDKKDYTHALQIFQLASQVNNTYADAYYWQAKCYKAMQKKNEAIKNYQTSLTLDPSLHEAATAINRLQNQ
jgi:tetratricopeptide (TPR) repeat protein